MNDRVWVTAVQILEQIPGYHNYLRGLYLVAIFKFIAKDMKTGDAVKVEIYLGNISKGFTPGRSDEYLIVETSQSGKYEWYAKRGGSKVDSGSSSGGNIFVSA